MWWALTAALAGDTSVELGGRFGLWGAPAPAEGADPGLQLAFLGAPHVAIWPSPLVGVDVEVGLVSGPSRITDAGWVGFVPALGLVVDPLGRSAGPVHPLVSLGIGLEVERHRTVDGVTLATWRSASFLGRGGLGLDARLAGALRLRFEAQGLLLVGTADDPAALRGGLLATVGVLTRFGAAKDGDRDGIYDRDDRCPDEAEDLDQFLDEDGCREPDNDGDGVRDELDACPGRPEDPDGVEDEDGCPEG